MLTPTLHGKIGCEIEGAQTGMILPTFPSGQPHEEENFHRHSDEEVERWSTDDRSIRLVPTHCAYCGLQCGMYLKVANGRVTGVEPREDFPFNQGKLCPKGVTAYQQIHHPDRLLYPLIKTENGKFRQASWDEAYALIVSKIREIQGTYGKDAFAVYSGSSLTTEKTYLMGKFARVGLQTKHVDYNGRLCMVAAATANNKAFGIDRAANPWSDILHTDCLLLTGTNTAECHPIMTSYVWRARDRGAKLIVIDPRQTPMARTADLHLDLRPGTDIPLANAILHVLIEEDLLDRDFIAQRTVGFDEVRQQVASYTPEYASQITGVDARKIMAAARMWGKSQKAMLFHARGIEHHTKGVDNVLSYINIVLATGQIGAEGKGYATITGQGNGQGGREHGQKADQLPGQRKIDDPAARQYISQVWGIDEADLPGPGTSVVEMFDQIHSGEIRGMLTICNNVMVSLPDVNWVRGALEKIDFMVAIDFFMSESCQYADVVLPGSAWAEDEGTTATVEGRVVKINRAADPPGEAKVDWEIICDLARLLGRGEYFPYKTPRAIFDELRVASKGGKADYYGITYEKIEQQNGVFWPCPTEDHPGTPRLFEDRFAHPDGKARFHAIAYREAAEMPDKEYPFYLTTGRTVYHYLSGNQTRRIGFLKEQAPEPWVEIHPIVAKRLGIENGERVRVFTRRGEVVLPAMVVGTIRPDTLFIPYHWGPPIAANQLTVHAIDPIAKIPEYKACSAMIARLAPEEKSAYTEQRQK
jgi:assimilatory nitrate reductase catalytic subunit